MRLRLRCFFFFLSLGVLLLDHHWVNFASIKNEFGIFLWVYFWVQYRTTDPCIYPSTHIARSYCSSIISSVLNDCVSITVVSMAWPSYHYKMSFFFSSNDFFALKSVLSDFSTPVLFWLLWMAYHFSFIRFQLIRVFEPKVCLL